MDKLKEMGIKFGLTDTAIKKAIRKYPPKTKFTSIFGAEDTVSDKDKIRVDGFGEIYVLCNSGQERLIYDGKYWATIHQ
jgi:hypothetical protein